jgi:hypothetical protein
VTEPASDHSSRPLRLTAKPPVPLRYWVFWMACLAIALVLFYVILTPVWMGIRLVSWLVEGRRFRVSAHGTR